MVVILDCFLMSGNHLDNIQFITNLLEYHKHGLIGQSARSIISTKNPYEILFKFHQEVPIRFPFAMATISGNDCRSSSGTVRSLRSGAPLRSCRLVMSLEKTPRADSIICVFSWILKSQHT